MCSVVTWQHATQWPTDETNEQNDQHSEHLCNVTIWKSLGTSQLPTHKHSVIADVVYQSMWPFTIMCIHCRAEYMYAADLTVAPLLLRFQGQIKLKQLQFWMNWYHGDWFDFFKLLATEEKLKKNLIVTVVC